jgi:hypothetical protein
MSIHEIQKEQNDNLAAIYLAIFSHGLRGIVDFLNDRTKW